MPDWTGAHVRMFRFFGGAPKLLVPDNLKSGVNKASFYDPEINRTYGAMAAHYSVGVLPARPGKPRDKAKVEAGVGFGQTWSPLRGLTFFSLAECNDLEGLRDLPRPGKPRVYDHDKQVEVFKTACSEPPEGETHWTVRSLAEAVGVGKSQTHAILAEADLKPHQVRSWLTSLDPEFDTKQADVCGLYLEPAGERDRRLAR